MVPLKQGEQGEKGIKLLGVYGEYWGVLEYLGEVAMAPHMEYLPTKSLFPPLWLWVEREESGRGPSRGGSGNGECCVLLELERRSVL